MQTADCVPTPTTALAGAGAVPVPRTNRLPLNQPLTLTEPSSRTPVRLAQSPPRRACCRSQRPPHGNCLGVGQGKRLVRGIGTEPVSRQSRNAAHWYRTSAPGLNHVSANGHAARAAQPLALKLLSPGAEVRYRRGAFRLRRGTGAVPVHQTNRLPLNQHLTLTELPALPATPQLARGSRRRSECGARCRRCRPTT
jgi:hypothetical protein